MMLQDPFRIDGAVVLVTGAGSGIGQAAALGLARAGAAKVILVGRREAALAETAKAVKAQSPATEPVALQGDVADAADRRRIAERVKALGRLDCLVNNAGLFEAASLRETSDEIWERHFKVNATAPLALTRDLVDLLAKSGNASVINVSSTLADKPIPNTAAYNASKAAVEQLTRTLALELGAERIRVNCIEPAIVETPMYRGRYPSDAEYEDGMKAAAKLHPIGRVGQPTDIANAVVFLASPASSWITGVVLPVDGGMLVT